MGPSTNITNNIATKRKNYEARFIILFVINLAISALLFATSFTEKDMCLDSCDLGTKSSEIKTIAILTVVPVIIAIYTSIRPFFLLKKASFKKGTKIALAAILAISIVNIFATPTERMTYDRYYKDYKAYYGNDTRRFCELHVNSSYCDNIESIVDVSDNVVACSKGISNWNAHIDLAKKYIENGNYENCKEYPDSALCDDILPIVQKFATKEKITPEKITNKTLLEIYGKKVTDDWAENLDLSPCEEVISEEKSDLNKELKKLSEVCSKYPNKYGCPTKR